MEQKKILWIVVAISVFILIIFGTALILYAPSRSSAAQQAAITPGTAMQTGDAGKQSIDPDSWVRDPGKTPGLDTTIPPQGNINLTIVNGDNAGANYGTMDVSGLTGASFGSDKTVAMAPTPEGIPGQDASPSTVKTDTATTDKSVSPGTTKVTTTTVTTAKSVKTETAVSGTKNATAKTTAVKATPVKAAATKPINVTEYWIQTGSFSNKLNAEKARNSLSARYLNAEIFTKDSAGKTAFRVRVGPYKTKTEADYWLGTVKEMQDFAGSYVSEVKTKK